MKKIIIAALAIGTGINNIAAFAYQDMAYAGKINNESAQVYYNESRNTLTLDGHDFTISVKNKNSIASQTYHNDKGQLFYAVLSNYQYDNQIHYAFALMNGALDKLTEIIFYVDLQCQKLKVYT